MEWSKTTLARFFVALTLVLAAFVLVPVSDAAACSPEPVSVHQTLDHNHAIDDMGSDQSVCTHGHCHHTASARHAASDLLLAEPFASSAHNLSGDDSMVSFVTDGLIRPPRN